MLPATRKVIRELLKGRYFRGITVDLGCGEGLAGRLLKSHSNYLIGVDHALGRLRLAAYRGYYDELVHSEIQHYTVPVTTEAVFMLDSLEHMSKKHGSYMLQRLDHVPFILVTTPETFHRMTFRNHHLSHWSEDELKNYGFSTCTFDCGLLGAFLGSRRSILAVKGL